MKWFNLVSFTVGLFSCFIVKGAELPPVENFSPNQYDAGSQNWAVAQSPDRLIYVANNNGLLEYNGAFWRLYPSTNETILRSVSVLGNRIYTGAYMEFGYWQKNDLGVLEYSSLSRDLDSPLLDDEEFWGIAGIDHWVIFQSLNRIYIYDSNNNVMANVIQSDGIINKMFVVDDAIFFQKLNEGIYKIENGEENLLIDAPLIRGGEVVNIFDDEDGLVLITKNRGLLSYQDEVLTQWSRNTEQLSDLGVYDAIRLENGNFALGTISNGLIYFSQDEGIRYEINQSRGLQNNTVLSVFEDTDGNIWMGLDNGISFINIDAPINIYNDENGILGSVYASAYLNDTLYLGTNQGLYYKRMYDRGPFTFIDNTEGQVWSLERINDKLFCGHHRGTFTIHGNRVKKIENTEGTWDIKKLDDKGDLLIQGNYDGLYVLERSRTQGWQLRNKIAGFNNSARSFEVLEDEIFVNHEYKGVFHLRADNGFSKFIESELDTLLKGSNSSIAKFQGDILYASSKGILKYSKSEGTFTKDSTLSTIYSDDNYISGKIIPGKRGDRFWTFTKENITVVSAGNLSDVLTIESLPLNLEMRRDVIEYENITGINGGDSYLLGTSFGYIMFYHEDFSIDDFEVRIGTISNGINSDHSASGFLLDSSLPGDFNSDENNLRIDFYSPIYFKYMKPTYQFQLLGLYDTWSEWNTQSSVFFENLPPGSYTFNVRAKLGEKVSGQVASYTFNIAKPWYATHFMLAVYLIGVILFSIFMHYNYRRYYHRQRRNLIEQNERDMELTRLQNEQEIIKIKNEQLKEDFKSKSNELAASIMSMARNNELLSEIKDHLTKVEDQQSLASVTALIDKNLSQDENWEFFREAFDSTDNEFFKKLNSMHPDLSPSDLKLCAYLRLNMSSKEIAQLTNISPKSVEIKRYRLRKKLDLESNQNLINYILNV